MTIKMKKSFFIFKPYHPCLELSSLFFPYRSRMSLSMYTSSLISLSAFHVHVFFDQKKKESTEFYLVECNVQIEKNMSILREGERTNKYLLIETVRGEKTISISYRSQWNH